jgi:hypothetical protein
MRSIRIVVGVGAVMTGLGLLASGCAGAGAKAAYPSAFCTAISDSSIDDPFHGAFNLYVARRVIPELKAAVTASSTPLSLKPAITTYENLWQAILVNAQDPTKEAVSASTSSGYQKATAAIWRYYDAACNQDNGGDD